MTRHYEAASNIAASAVSLFAHLDDQTRLAHHMSKPSAMMGGGAMTYEFDAGGGMAVGSHIRMAGRAFGIELQVDEVVTARHPPLSKAWETTGKPRLLIVGGYAMGFRITPLPSVSRLTVWIDYTLPEGTVARLLGSLFAGSYARWCVSRMISDAALAFPAGPEGAR